MARIEGIDPNKTSFLMRQVFRSVRKIFGKNLTPQKIQARVPRLRGRPEESAVRSYGCPTRVGTRRDH